MDMVKRANFILGGILCERLESVKGDFWSVNLGTAHAPRLPRRNRG